MMRMFVAMIGMIGLVSASPATACSFSWNPGWSPEEIKERKDLRKVTGRFEVVEIDGVGDAKGALEKGTIYGRLTTLRGTGWETWQPFDRISLDCGAYRRPMAAGEGTFWISRRKVDGRYQILLWEGTYLPAQDEANEEDGQSATGSESDAT